MTGTRVHRLGELTPTEAEVLRRLCELPIRKPQEVARDMGRSDRTIRSTISHILSKLEVPDLRGAVVIEMTRRIDNQGISLLAREGSERLILITSTPLNPVEIDAAVSALSIPGGRAVVLESSVPAILRRLAV